MAYFVLERSNRRYISLFFRSKENDAITGNLIALNAAAMRLTSFLPGLFVVMLMATVAELGSWIGEWWLSVEKFAVITHSAMWGGMCTSMGIAIITALIVWYSQNPGIKNNDYFCGARNSIVKVDWLRSMSIYSNATLFAFNGAIFTLWVNFDPVQVAEEGRMPNFWLVFAVFLVGVLPGAFRLVWLFNQRCQERVIWAGVK